MDDAGGPPGPLAGILVADFSRVLAGPYASMLLGDLRLLKLSNQDKAQAKKAVDSYALALQEVVSAEGWINSLLTLARCRDSLDSTRDGHGNRS